VNDALPLSNFHRGTHINAETMQSSIVSTVKSTLSWLGSMIIPSMFVGMGQYTVQKELATSTISGNVVLLCLDNCTGDQVAVKRVNLATTHTQTTTHDSEQISEDDNVEKHANQVLSSDGGHKHVLAMRTHFIQDGSEHFVFDYCSGGQLYNVVTAPTGLPNEALLRYFRQILSGVRYMHMRGIAHRNLSLHKMLLDEHDDVKLVDFGLAVTVPSIRDEALGNYHYMAPEVIWRCPHDPVKADVWSLGIALFIMLSGEKPFEMSSFVCQRFRSMQLYGLRGFVRRSGIADRFEPEAMDLLVKMLRPDPEIRFTMEQVMSHAYVRGPAVNMAESVTSSNTAEVSISQSVAVNGKDRASPIKRDAQKLKGRPSSRKFLVASSQFLASCAVAALRWG
jgi:serine/threonine protein kinase